MKGFMHHSNLNVDVSKLYGVFTIWAEESADTNSGAYEWAFGNGNDTPIGMGILLPIPCELFAIGLMTEGVSSNEVEVRKNNLSTGKSVVSSNSKQAMHNFDNDVIAFNANDVLGFRTITGSIEANGAVVCAWLRHRLDYFSGA